MFQIFSAALPDSKKKMNRIILLSFDYPPNNGGISRLCDEISKGLISRSVDFHVLTNVAGLCDNERYVTRICGKRGTVEFKIISWIKKYTDKNDIIVCDTWHPGGTIAMLSGRKFFILAHGAEFLPGLSVFRSKIWPVFRRHVLKKAEGIIANSRYTANLVNSLATGLKTTAIPLAIDADLFHPTKEKNTDDDILRLCSISRLEKFKGHDFIISTIASLPKQYRKRIRLEIGGKGPYKNTLEKLVVDNGLQDIVTFTGYIAEGEMNDFYSRNDIFILCTREERDRCNVEGFGLVFVEAQACGTACIGTNAGGIPDAIHNGRGGWLISQDSEPELSQLLIGLIANKKYAQEQGAVARERVIEECSQAGYIQRFIQTVNVD